MILRYLKRTALIALAVLFVLFLHNRVQREAEEAEAAKKPAAADTEQTEEQGAEGTQSISVLRMGDVIALGHVESNGDKGGVRVVVPQSDGSDKVYVFTDVGEDSWYVEAVNFVVSAGLMTGVGDEDIFQPEFGMLRESFAAILYRYTKGTPVEPRYTFDDVKKDSWYYDAVSWATNERLMSSIEPSVFGVGHYMTCEQALMGLYRLAGEPETDGSLADYPYAGKVTDSGRNAVDWAWKNGLITEVECVWYPPQAISRAQVALLLMRYSKME